jgi:hypothetical protein
MIIDDNCDPSRARHMPLPSPRSLSRKTDVDFRRPFERHGPLQGNCSGAGSPPCANGTQNAPLDV